MSEPITTKSAFQAKGRRIHRFFVPTLQEEVCLRSMSGMERARLGSTFKKFAAAEVDEQTKEVMLPALAKCLVTEAGDRIYSDDDVAELGNLDAPVLDELLMELMRISGLNKDAAGEAEKNSVATPSDASTSG